MKSEVAKEMANHEGFSAFANYLWKGRLLLALGGYITLTSTKLEFKPHNLNFNRDIVTIELANIERVTPLKLLALFPRGIIVYTKNSTKYKFIMDIKDAKIITNKISVL